MGTCRGGRRVQRAVRRSALRQLRLRGPDRAQRLLPVGSQPGRVPDLVATPARRRRAAGQRAPDADGRAVRPPGPRLGRRARHPGDRLQARGTQARDRRGVPGHPPGGPRGVPDPGGARGGPGLGGHPLDRRGAVQPGQEAGLRQPLLLPHPGPGVGTHDDQDVRASTVRGAGHPQRPRVRRRRGPGGRHRLRQGGQLLHPHRRPRRPGPDRRHLVAARDDRAPGPGLRPVDLHRLPVLRAGPGRAATLRVRLRLLGLSGRVQPQPAVHHRRPDGPGVRPDRRPHPVPAGRADPADPVRRQATPRPQRHPRPVTRSSPP